MSAAFRRGWSSAGHRVPRTGENPRRSGSFPAAIPIPETGPRRSRKSTGLRAVIETFPSQFECKVVNFWSMGAPIRVRLFVICFLVIAGIIIVVDLSTQQILLELGIALLGAIAMTWIFSAAL